MSIADQLSKKERQAAAGVTTAIPAETARPRLTKIDAGEYRLGPYRISRRWQSGRACPTPFGNRSWWCITKGDDFIANEPTLARVRERLAR